MSTENERERVQRKEKHSSPSVSSSLPSLTATATLASTFLRASSAAFASAYNSAFYQSCTVKPVRGGFLDVVHGIGKADEAFPTLWITSGKTVSREAFTTRDQHSIEKAYPDSLPPTFVPTSRTTSGDPFPTCFSLPSTCFSLPPTFFDVAKIRFLDQHSVGSARAGQEFAPITERPPSTMQFIGFFDAIVALPSFTLQLLKDVKLSDDSSAFKIRQCCSILTTVAGGLFRQQRPLKGVPSHEAYKNWPILNGMISKDGPNFNNGSRGSSEPNGQNTIGSKLKPLEGKKSGEKSDEISFGLVKILKGQNANDSVGIVLDEGSLPYIPPQIVENKIVAIPLEEAYLGNLGSWHLGGKPMLIEKWTLGIILESFGFNSVPVWIRLGKIPMELWTEAGLTIVASVVGKPITLDLATKEKRRLSYARVYVELDVDSPMLAEITDTPSKREELANVACGKVVIESFKQLEEGEIKSSLDRPSCQMEKEVGERDEFTLVTRKKRELVSVRDRGKSLEVTMPNSFDSLLEGLNNPVKCKAMFNFLGSSSIGFCCLLKTRVRESNFRSVSSRSIFWCWVDVFCVYASNSNTERRLLWHQLVEITFGWSIPGVVVGDFNAIRLHFEAFRGSSIQGDMEDLDLAICNANLVEPSV
ncbi:DUF4283 domain-containing protein [Cucumis melo var. makuwa]|uniref:DUF4283 domain-containing protein n=1 Tax=Cucumis melo var. makuwa TaxID=1194695 RepID=A0A5A7SI67_CUCMM|nr:DUF4283 domain-containing protein [Cucumis melo var. makuwa]TYK22605.1 DUF4283 domain-containing protein [Cucumis melo var. makuwa]